MPRKWRKFLGEKLASYFFYLFIYFFYFFFFWCLLFRPRNIFDAYSLSSQLPSPAINNDRSLICTWWPLRRTGNLSTFMTQTLAQGVVILSIDIDHHTIFYNLDLSVRLSVSYLLRRLWTGRPLIHIFDQAINTRDRNVCDPQIESMYFYIYRQFVRLESRRNPIGKALVNRDNDFFFFRAFGLMSFIGPGGRLPLTQEIQVVPCK